MKKLFLLFAVASMSLSIYSCRETTEENMEEDMEQAGDNVESEMEEAGNDIEEAGEDMENEMEEEVEGTDDMNGDDDL